MTGRIDDETKFDSAIARGARVDVAVSRAGDNCGLVVFGRKSVNICRQNAARTHRRRARSSSRPRTRVDRAVVRPGVSVYRVKYEKTSFVVILPTRRQRQFEGTDHTNCFGHAIFRSSPPSATAIYAARQRSTTRHQSGLHAVRRRGDHPPTRISPKVVESLGGIAIDVTAQTLAPKLLESYLRVKERGLL